MSSLIKLLLLPALEVVISTISVAASHENSVIISVSVLCWWKTGIGFQFWHFQRQVGTERWHPFYYYPPNPSHVSSHLQLVSWWRHQMETFSALLAICAGNSPISGEFPAQRPVTRSFDVFFDMHPNKRLSKQWWGWWFETPSCPLWRYRNVMTNAVPIRLKIKQPHLNSLHLLPDHVMAPFKTRASTDLACYLHYSKNSWNYWLYIQTFSVCA